MAKFVDGYNIEIIEKFFNIPALQNYMKKEDFDSVFKRESIFLAASIIGVSADELMKTNIPSFIMQQLRYPLLEKMATLYGGMFSSDLHIDRLIIPENITKVQCAAIDCHNLKVIEVDSEIELEEGYKFVHDCSNLESIIFHRRQNFYYEYILSKCTECPKLKIYGLNIPKFI